MADTDSVNEQSITANLFGQSVAAKGTSGLIILVLLCFAGGSGYLLYDRSLQNEAHINQMAAQQAIDRERQTKQMNGEHESISVALRGMQEVLKESADAQRVQNYLNLTDDKERQSIKKRITMPDSLRKQMNNFHE